MKKYDNENSVTITLLSADGEWMTYPYWECFNFDESGILEGNYLEITAELIAKSVEQFGRGVERVFVTYNNA